MSAVLVAVGKSINIVMVASLVHRVYRPSEVSQNGRSRQFNHSKQQNRQSCGVG